MEDKQRRQFPGDGERIVLSSKRPKGKFDCRLPTDEEYITYRRRTDSLTDRRAVADVGARLFRSLCKNPPDENMDQALLLSKLMFSQMDDASPELVDDGILITCGRTLPGIPVSFTMKIPSAEQHERIREGLKTARNEGVLSPESIEIYDELQLEADGFNGDVPIWLKQTALFGVIMAVEQIDNQDELDDVENFSEPSGGETGQNTAA